MSDLRKDMEDKIKAVEDQVKMQCRHGNWNYDPYMHGMANGLICALATIKGEEPQFLTAPEKWLRDMPISSSLEVEEIKP